MEQTEEYKKWYGKGYEHGIEHGIAFSEISNAKTTYELTKSSANQGNYFALLQLYYDKKLYENTVSKHKDLLVNMLDSKDL